MKDASSSLAYHEATRHSEVSLRASGHYLGWTNKPSVFKIYWNLPSISLPCSFPHHQEPVLKVMRGEIGQQGNENAALRDCRAEAIGSHWRLPEGATLKAEQRNSRKIGAGGRECCENSGEQT